jgi:hypothetical protein
MSSRPAPDDDFDAFRRCRTCGQIYWRGSHHARLAEVVERIRAATDPLADVPSNRL